MADNTCQNDGLGTLQGVNLVEQLKPLLAQLRSAGVERDRAGNREFFFDHLCGLILLTFFNPILSTQRDLQRASRLKQVQQKLGCPEVSGGSLSEGLRVFDPQLLTTIIQQLLERLPESPHADPRLKALAHTPTAVDGSLLLHLPQVTQACFSSRTDRGWKLHAHFEVLRGAATRARVTDASGKGPASERAVLRATLEEGHCYAIDRGYEEIALYNAIVLAKSSYVGRVRNDHHFTVEETREVTPEAQAVGVVEDTLGRMGSPNSKRIEQPSHLQRRIVVRVVEHPKRGGRRRRGATHDLVLVTNLLDVPAEVIVLLYRFRWLIELFFRWLKCVLDCRHLLSRSAEGIQIQMHCALIACLLIQLAAGSQVRPNQWTYKLFCLCAQGWASEEEVMEHLRELAAAQAKNEG